MLSPEHTPARNNCKHGNRDWPHHDCVGRIEQWGNSPCWWRSDVYSTLSCWTYRSHRNSSTYCCINRRNHHRAILPWITPACVCRTSDARGNTVRLLSTDVRIFVHWRNLYDVHHNIRPVAIRNGVGSSSHGRQLGHRYFRQQMQCRPSPIHLAVLKQ